LVFEHESGSLEIVGLRQVVSAKARREHGSLRIQKHAGAAVLDGGIGAGGAVICAEATSAPAIKIDNTVASFKFAITHLMLAKVAGGADRDYGGSDSFLTVTKTTFTS